MDDSICIGLESGGVDTKQAEAMLRRLPEWFGQDEPLRRYAAQTAVDPTFTASQSQALVGFLTVHREFERAAEVDCIAVDPRRHGNGVGTALMQAAEAWLRGCGVRYLQVKTLSERSQDPNYALTREFYRRCGFEPLQRVPTPVGAG